MVQLKEDTEVRSCCLTLAGVVFLPLVALFICYHRPSRELAVLVGLILASLTVLFLLFYIPYKLLGLFFGMWKNQREAYWGSRSGITRQFFREMKADRRNIRRWSPSDMEDEIEVMDEEARVSFVRRLKEGLWDETKEIR